MAPALIRPDQIVAWRGNSEWTQSPDDADYYRHHPVV